MLHSVGRENLLKNILYKSESIGLILLNKQLTILEWNIGMERLTGLSAQKITNDNLIGIFPSFANSPVYKHIVRIFSGEPATDDFTEIPAFWKDTSDVYRYSISLNSHAEEHPNCLILIEPVKQQITIPTEGIFNDLRMRMLFDQTSIPSAVYHKGVHLLVNKAYVNLFGYESAEDLLGSPVLDLIASSERDKVVQRIKDRYHGKDVNDKLETIGIKKDGTLFPVQFQGSPVHLPEGQVTYSYIRDITQEKGTEINLKKSEAKFKGVFDTSLIGIVFCDKEGVHDANNTFLKLIGYTREDLDKNGLINWNEITPPEYLKLNSQISSEIMEKGSIPVYEKEYIRKDGSHVPVLITASMIPGMKDLGLGFVVDISDLRKSQEAANKIAKELTTFLYMASHDLKGPLASVIGLTLIAEKECTDPAALEYFKLIKECTLKLDSSLVNFLKIIQIRGNSYERSKIDFRPIITGIIESLKHQMPVTFDFKIFISNKRDFYSDPDLIKAILYNLLDNAVKYHPRIAAPWVRISIEERKDELVLEIEDNGKGISEKIKDKIFDLFYRGDLSSKGSGLGLFIVKIATERLNGSVGVTNKTEGGAVFTIKLPFQPN